MRETTRGARCPGGPVWALRLAACLPRGFGRLSLCPALLWPQVITLEGWVEIMYYVMDAHSFYNFIYFILLIIVSVRGWGSRASSRTWARGPERLWESPGRPSGHRAEWERAGGQL